MTDKADYHADKILNLLRNTTYTAAATMYAALYSANVGEGGVGGTEISTAGYARQAITFGAPSGSAGARQVANSAAVTFGPFTADPPNITGMAILDASTAGNMLYHDALATARDPATDDSVEFATSALVVSET